jgi:hypothetical protein
MIRYLLLGLVVAGLGVGLQHGWVEVRADRFYRDLGIELNDDGKPDPFRAYAKPKQLW